LTQSVDYSKSAGLSSTEAEKRLREFGANELPAAKKRSLFFIALDVIREPMFLLLIACGAIYLVLGDVQEAAMLLGFVIVVIGITLYQEQKTERAIEALRDLSSPRALVIRDGAEKRIAGREVVTGDILVLHEGDRVPADAVLLSCINLSVDESLLTGESVPVRKMTSENSEAIGRPGGDDQPFVYSSTLVVQGLGIAEVKATGIWTEIGKIGKALQSVEPELTRLQKETGRLVRNLSFFGLSLCAVVIVVYGLTRSDWLQGFLAGITLAMATLPEEFPVVLTIFLALGAWRMSKEKVLTRKVPAVETLGSATVLCVDKTGTLTQNRMTIAKMHAGADFFDVPADDTTDLPEAFHELVEFSILASQRDPFDPMEKAITHLGDRYLAHTEHLHQDWSLVREYPLSKKLLALSHVWTSPDGSDFVIATKGAPEAIADLCHLDDTQMGILSKRIGTMADEGLRVLGVAKSRFTETSLPGQQHDFEFEWLGLIGLADPIRPSVPAAVRECGRAGIRVIMITGDYPGTALNIARQIGLEPNDRCVTGPELDRMSEEELRLRVAEVNIFARTVPEQKLMLVQALRANGEIVAMTGDGVNDAPALKASHIGIAMGERGTDVARESASLVLLDDDFSSIVKAIRMGRRIFDNIKKAMAYVFAVHVPIAGLSLIPVVLGWPLVLLPVHIVFLELIIDPSCSVVFEMESEETGIMNRPPRNPDESLFGRKVITLSLLQGLSVLMIALAVCAIALKRGLSIDEVRGLTFTTLIAANLALIMTNRSWKDTIVRTLRTPNSALWWVLGGALIFLTATLTIPTLRTLFHFAPLHPRELLICLAAGLFSIMWFEILKMFNARKVSV
jgi:Ca2+-transporting ATPase